MNQFNPVTGGHNLHNDEFVLMQSSYFDGFKSIAYSFSETGNVIFDGVRLSNNGTTLTFTYGHVAIAGEICEVAAGTTPYYSSQIIYIKIVQTSPAVPPGDILYEDGTLKPVHIKRVAIITYDNSDLTGIDYNTFIRPSYHQVGDLMDWILPSGKVLTDYFDNTGLGIGQRTGWAICNGLNGTPDLRGFYRAQATSVPGNATLNSRIINPVTGTYFTSTVSNAAGSHSLSITQANLPAYNLNVTVAPHSHNILYNHQDERGANSSPNIGTTSDLKPNNGSNALNRTGVTEQTTVGVVVNSGGGGQAALNVPPTFYTYTLMKIE